MRNSTLPMSIASVLALVLNSAGLAAVPSTTVSFQQEVAGYNGTFDRRIGLGGNTPVNGADVDTDVEALWLDGGPTADNRADFLIRFDDIIDGTGIPAGAVILDATLDLKTTSADTSGNAQSNGAYNVYRLTQSFDGSSAMETDFGGGTPGVEPEDGEADWILGSFHGQSAADDLVSANVTRAVQSWADGSTNYGLGVATDRSGDGWSVHSTGASTIANRPKLNVTYTTHPRVQVHEFQQGQGGYNGTTDVVLNRATDTNDTNEDRSDDTVITRDGSTVSEDFLDGDNGAESYDSPYMIKFDNLFGGNLNQGDGIVKAELVLVTGFASGAANSGGPYSLHQLLTPFSTSSAYSEFAGDHAAMVAAGEIAPATGAFTDMEDTEVVTMDVTSVVRNWSAGDPNHGFYIGADGTSNGWQLFTSGAADSNFAPMLRIVSVPEPGSFVLFGFALAIAGATACRRRESWIHFSQL